MNSILRALLYYYFKTVHAFFWLYNNLFKTRRLLPPPALNDEHLLHLSATEAAKLIREKQLSSLRLIEAYIRRIKEINPVLNAVVQHNYSQAVQDARAVDKWLSEVDVNSEDYKTLSTRKPLLGVPITIKDCFQVKDMIITCGIPSLENSPPCEEDAQVVAHLKDAGGIVLAVTNVPEACLWWQTKNGIYGQTNNPYDSRRGVGGSSGGEGGLIGAGGSLVGVGSDIGGSIRMPAFFNGIFGLKPSTGLVSIDGHIPYPATEHRENMLAAGPLCRYARDLPLMLKVMVGPKSAQTLQLDRPIDLSKIRVFFMDKIDDIKTSRMHFACSQATKQAVKHFEQKYDLPVHNINFPIHHDSVDLWFNKMHSEKRTADLLEYKENSDLSPLKEMLSFSIGRSKHLFVALVAAFVNDQQKKSKEELDKAHDRIIQLKREVQSLLGTDGILIFPGFPRPAYFHNEAIFCANDVAYTALWSTLELPVVSCPMGLNSNGLPVGIQVVGGEGSEALLMAVAQSLEDGFGGWKPPGFKAQM